MRSTPLSLVEREPTTTRPVPLQGRSPVRNRPRLADKLERLFRSCRRSRKGAAAVEFALVAPLFFLLILGMIEVGRALMVQQVITSASREGARLAVLDNVSRAEVDATVERYLANATLAPETAQITVTPEEPNDAGYDEPVTVTVQIGFDQVSWLPSPMFLVGGRNLSATTIMRRETVQ